MENLKDQKTVIAAQNGASTTVLLVDDEEGLRLLWTSFLQRNDIKVISADNGLEGLKLYAAHRDEIKLVITDHHMPVMQGATMVREIRRVNPGARVLVVSTNSLDLYPEGVFSLPKPFGLDVLLAKIRLLCR